MRESPDDSAQSQQPQQYRSLTRSDADLSDAESLTGHRDIRQDSIPLGNTLVDRLFFGAIAIIICLGLSKVSIATDVPLHHIVLVILIALAIGYMAIQAEGATGSEPAPSLAKLSQVCLGFIITSATPHIFLINMIGGAIAEATAVQAADLMAYFKANSELRAPPDKILLGQLIGSVYGSIVAVSAYKWFLRPETKGELGLTAAHMWMAAAKVALGSGLPEGVIPVASFTLTVFAAIAVIRIMFPWMYNTPAYTAAWLTGGIIHPIWRKGFNAGEDTIKLSGSSLMLGEGAGKLVVMVIQWFYHTRY